MLPGGFFLPSFVYLLLICNLEDCAIHLELVPLSAVQERPLEFGTPTPENHKKIFIKLFELSTMPFFVVFFLLGVLYLCMICN